MTDNNIDIDLDAHLNLQTAKIQWSQLQRPFARGDIIYIASQLDLLEVAKTFIADDKSKVQTWQQKGQLIQPDTETAKKWHASDACFWAVVVAPWVLIQDVDT